MFGHTWTWGEHSVGSFPLAAAFHFFLLSQFRIQEASVCPQVCAARGTGQSGLSGAGVGSPNLSTQSSFDSSLEWPCNSVCFLSCAPVACSSSLNSIHAPERGAMGTALAFNLLSSQPQVCVFLCVRTRPRVWLGLYSVLRLQSLQNDGVEHNLHAPSNSFPVCNTVVV